MILNRFVAGVGVLVFNVVAIPSDPGELRLLSVGLYILLGLVVGVHFLLRPFQAVGRRFCALLLDLGAVTYELHIGGGQTAWLFPAYLWVVFGNGFRFGPRFLVAAMIASIALFIIGALSTPFWSSHPSLIVGVVIGLIILPLYALGLIRTLSLARRLAEQASQAKSLFLASVSHELRTPLNAVIGMGALLEGSRLDPEQMEMSRTIMTSARSLLSLIDGILDLSRIEAGRMPLVSADFDLARILGDLRVICLPQARGKGIRLHLHVAPDTPLHLTGDARRLQEILLNLVGNALKFTETGSVAVLVRVKQRTEVDARLRFEVRDTGIGIDPSARERIFDDFTQADDTIVRRFGGTGLGLAITRKLVHLLHGEIGVESQLRVGSTFWFEVPFARRPAASIPAEELVRLRALVVTREPRRVAPLLGILAGWGVGIQPIDAQAVSFLDRDGAEALESAAALIAVCDRDSSGEAPGSATPADNRHVIAIYGAEDEVPEPAALFANAVLSLPVQDPDLASALYVAAYACRSAGAAADTPRLQTTVRYRILVADDNATNQRVLEKILRTAGHEVAVVADGDEALDQLAAKEFDLAILDVNMPGLSGIEAAKLYRFASLGERSVPLIALTADATPETRDLCLEAGMADCVVKPIEPLKLLELVDRIATDASRANTSVPSRVTPIASHVRFRGASPPALDPEVLSSLRALDGEEFVAEIFDSFMIEARRNLDALRRAAAESDVSAFRSLSHAMRSIGANIGARPLSELCLPFQTLSLQDLRHHGGRYVEQIAAELSRIELAFVASKGESAAQSIG